jgi:hypothetical protein
MSSSTSKTDALPPLCYIRHVTTGETVMIRRGKAGYVPVDTVCSPECLNGRLPRVPTEDEIAAMRHGSLMGWEGPGVDASFWRRQRERRS